AEKLVHEGRLYTAFVPVLLRMRLDGALASLWESGHVSVNELWNAFSRYLYLPRLRDLDVLLETVRAGANSTVWEAEGFGVAEALDDDKNRYLGLTVRGFHQPVTATTLVIQPTKAGAQAEAGRLAASQDTVEGAAGEEQEEESGDGRLTDGKLRRFYGSVQLDPNRLNRDFGRVAQEVIAHLTGLVDAQ